MLGTTIGNVENNTFTPTSTTAFGAGNEEAFFTGKPYVEGLGHAFLFRNYRPEIGKWQTQDPLGFPDGWNNFAYCNNWIIDCFDWSGASIATSANSAYLSIVTASGQTYSGYVSSVADATKFLLDNTGGGSDKITNFTYTGHGGEGGVLCINSETNEGLTPSSFAAPDPQVKQMMSSGQLEKSFGYAVSETFASSSNLQFNSCYTGNYLRDFTSRIPGATATGFTGELTPLGPLSWEIVFANPKSWFTGKWVTE